MSVHDPSEISNERADSALKFKENKYTSGFNMKHINRINYSEMESIN